MCALHLHCPATGCALVSAGYTDSGCALVSAGYSDSGCALVNAGEYRVLRLELCACE